jgi:hypothetical protein
LRLTGYLEHLLRARALRVGITDTRRSALLRAPTLAATAGRPPPPCSTALKHAGAWCATSASPTSSCSRPHAHVQLLPRLLAIRRCARERHGLSPRRGHRTAPMSNAEFATIVGCGLAGSLLARRAGRLESPRFERLGDPLRQGLRRRHAPSTWPRPGLYRGWRRPVSTPACSQDAIPMRARMMDAVSGDLDAASPTAATNPRHQLGSRAASTSRC